MNRVINLSLTSGGTLGVQSDQILYMGKPSNGSYRLTYQIGGRLSNIETTTTPSSIEGEVAYLAEINNDFFSLINSHHIYDTVDNTTDLNMRYKIPGGRLIDLGTVEMTLASLHTEFDKSTGKTEIDDLALLVTAAELEITDLKTAKTAQDATNLAQETTNLAAIAELQSQLTKITSMADGVIGPKKDKP